MVEHGALEAKPAKPTIGQVQMDLVAKPSLGANAEAVPDDQHPDHQFGIDRWPAGVAVERPQMRADAGKIDEAVDRPQQVLRRNMPLQAELVEQRPLRHCSFAHHWPPLHPKDD